MPCPSSTRRRRRIFKTLARVLAHPLLLLSLLLLLPIYGSPEQDAREANREALLQFKSSITADPGGLLSGWSDSAASDPCSWSGVSCDSRSRVWALNISGGGNSDLFSCSSRSGPFRGVSCSDQRVRLTGNLSPAIGKLSELRVLSLPFHGFDGKIPDEIWSLGNLSVLDLEGNSISGTLPLSFPPYLKVLNLGFNKLTDVIPPSLSSSVDLEIVNLSQNQLFGTIPGFFGKLDKLRRLDLSFNGLGGPVPDEIGSGCPSLEHMDLSGNQLVGGIPPSLGNCRELQSLLLFSNLFDDIIPPDLGNLTKLQVLDLSRNSLSGPVPEELGNCVELSVLVLSNPSDPVLSKDGETDDFNYFQGGIPENITSLPKLRMLWAPRVTLEGDVPVNWGACKSLEIVNLGQNLFTGQIPTVFEQCQNLNYVNLSSNKLTGWLSVGLQVPCMAVFDVSGNQLSGSVPSFIYKGCSSFNFLSDDLSTAYSTFFAGRRRTGSSLPLLESSGNFTIIHNFGANNFSGTMPYLPIATERLGNQTVYAFLVDGNKLGGSFPGYLFDKCKDLNGLFLNISNNLISGGIPAEIGHMCGSLKVLDARGNRLSGAIPQSFGLLDSLVSLDLSWNRLHGEIPASIGQLKGLTYLSLAGNNLSGGISVGLGQLHSLEVLDLSSNNLSGEIPGDFVNLRNLSVLLLNNNKLSGKIPSGVANVMPLSMFNVSFNNLSGSVPSMRCDSILGNPLLQPCSGYSFSAPPSDLQGGGGGYQPVTASPPGSLSDNSSNSVFSSIEIASITSAAAIVSVLLVLIALYIYTRKCVPRSSVQVTGRREVTVFTDIGVPLTYENVVRATGSFNASNCIGSGGFGATYKAEIAPGVLVAIKRLSVGRFQGVQQFHAEIKTLGRWRHPNLVTLIGYHVSEAEMFLIYNYLPGGNLERFIQERSKRVVDWRMLHKIALDVARALSYLHDHCVPRILHRDVKPSNILLDNDFNAYLSDFGLARLLGNSETHATTGVAGTFGYVAPEYAMTCRVSDKADVYSYGVVLLELISDKKALDPSFSPYGNGFNIVAWACMLLRQGRAREFFTNGLWDVGPHDDLVETLHLAVMCTVDSLSVRPTMKQVVQRLKQLQPPTC